MCRTHTCKHIYLLTYTHKWTHKHTTHAYIHKYTHTHKHTQTHKHTNKHTHTQIPEEIFPGRPTFPHFQQNSLRIFSRFATFLWVPREPRAARTYTGMHGPCMHMQNSQLLKLYTKENQDFGSLVTCMFPNFDVHTYNVRHT